MRLALFLLAGAASGSLPDWISPAHIREELAEALENRDRVVSLSEEDDLLRTSEEDDENYDIGHRIYLSSSSREAYVRLSTGRGGYFQLDQIANEVGVDAEFCIQRISNFWAVREAWFVPSISDIKEARECLDLSLKALRLVNPTTQANLIGPGSVLAEAVADLMNVLFSPMVESRIRFPRIAGDSIPGEARADWQFFAEYMRDSSSGGLRDLLDETAAQVDEDRLNSLAPNNHLYTRHIIEGTWSEHAGDFLDHCYFEGVTGPQSFEGYGVAVLPYWKYLIYQVEIFDMLEFDFSVSKVDIIESPAQDLMGRFHGYVADPTEAREGWILHVGAFLSQMWAFASKESVETLLGCLPLVDADFAANIYKSTPAVYAALVTGGPTTIIKTYRCIADGVNSGSIVLPEESNKADLVSTVIHMLRVATSVPAFLVAHT